MEKATEHPQWQNEAAGGASAVERRVRDRVPFCSEELNDLMTEFVEVMCEFGMTEIDDVIDIAIARCAVKKSRRERAEPLLAKLRLSVGLCMEAEMELVMKHNSETGELVCYAPLGEEVLRTVEPDFEKAHDILRNIETLPPDFLALICDARVRNT